MDPSEVPDDCGLLWAAKNLGKLYTKKKAPWRDVDGLEDTYKAVLINRARIQRGRFGGMAAEYQSREWWEERIADEEGRQRIAHDIRGAVREHVLRVEEENRDLLGRCAKAEAVEQWLKENGLDRSWRPQEELNRLKLRQAEAIDGALSGGTLRALQNLRRSIDDLLNKTEHEARP